MWWACQLVPSGFSSTYDAWSLLSCLCPFLSLCHVLSSRIKHNTFSRGWLLSSPFFDGSQKCASSTTRDQRWHSETVSTSHSMGREQGWGHLKANLGYSGSSLLEVAYLPLTSFIGRIFSGRSRVGLAWVQTR